MVSCALWELEEALRWVILNNALAPLVHYSESPNLVPLQILHNAQLTILYMNPSCVCAISAITWNPPASVQYQTWYESFVRKFSICYNCQFNIDLILI